MPIDKTPNSEPIRGYRLIEPLGSGGFGEVWKCEAPGGIFKAIKFVRGGGDKDVDDRSTGADEELRAVQHIKSIRHPFLLSIDRVEVVNGELVIVTELADQNLHELLDKYRALGRAGVPRDEILTYLREAAEVLDLMNLKFDLQHLDIKPRNLFLVSNHVKVADFGLVNSLSGGKVHLGAITPVYAAPELFMNKMSRHCDQYSLAIVYLELLTGALPFAGKNSRQLLLQHTQSEPDLSTLPEDDRPIIARALAKSPDHRFASCMGLVKALMGETTSRPVSYMDMPPPEARLGETTATEAVAAVQVSRTPNLPTTLLAGFRSWESVGATPLMETWRARAIDGRRRLVKLLYGFNTEPRQLQETLARLKTLQHPGVMTNEVLHVDLGRVVLASDPMKETVRDRFQKCLAGKLPGVPRSELLDYLRAAAEVLDYLYQQHGVQHLMLNPRSLVLDNGWLQLADFGLAQLLWLPVGQDVAQHNNRYSAPELFDRSPGKACDQFSLAVLYAEMVSGQHPFRAVGNLAWSNIRENPALDGLTPTDQLVIRRALDPNPDKRWPNCTDMLLALEGSISLIADDDRFQSMIQSSRKEPAAPSQVEGAPNSISDVEDLIRSILGDTSGESVAGESTEIDPDTNAITHIFQIGLPVGSARIKVDSFSKQWEGQTVKDDEKEGILLDLAMPASIWQQWLGRRPGIEVRINLVRVNSAAPTPIEVAAKIRAVRCNAKRARDLMDEMGSILTDSLRKHLLVNSEKRTQDRVAFPFEFRVIPVHFDGTREDPVACRGKDLSRSGIGFYLPHELTTSEVLVEMPSTTHPPHVLLPAMLVRAKPSADGWYEVGGLFRVAGGRKSNPEIILPTKAAK